METSRIAQFLIHTRLCDVLHMHTNGQARSHAFLQENLREGSDILRAGTQEDGGKGKSEEDNQADAQRKTTLAKLCRALSTIDENDEGLLSLQQLLQVRHIPMHNASLLLVHTDAAGDGI